MTAEYVPTYGAHSTPEVVADMAYIRDSAIGTMFDDLFTLPTSDRSEEARTAALTKARDWVDAVIEAHDATIRVEVRAEIAKAILDDSNHDLGGYYHPMYHRGMKRSATIAEGTP